ncbi:MAG TPA: GTPase Era [Burkholderiales bacterium]|nr:GTPase Era [Burkholderiales bacterium]
MAGAGAHRCGYVTIVGRPNVGKSTLLNRLTGLKVSITSRKPQTTRNAITGIVTRSHAQTILVDTPGFQTRFGSALNRGMNRVVTQSLAGVDAVLMVVEALKFGAEDRRLLEMLPVGKPVLLVINKTDRVADRKRLLPFIKQLSEQRDFAEIVPISAAKGKGIEKLLELTAKYLPQGPAIHAADEITEASERFLAAELIREKIFRLLGDELPYVSAVIIDDFVEEPGLRRIQASIIVDKDTHKGIVIGARGARLKEIASAARHDMEKLFGDKVFLEVWVKVKPGWIDDARFLKRIGHD